MNAVHKSVLIWYSPQQMFDLVSDVPRYPQFLPWCDAAHILQKHADGQTAEISLNFKGLRQKFSTRNTHVRHESGAIEERLSLVQGPFSQLEGQWLFSPLRDIQSGAAPSACKVELFLSYSFGNAAMAALVGPVFDKIASSLVDAFVQRAESVYG
ncbi:MAG: type II toxin-antitoxin system RatA family toxin [Brachymonas sp.]|nr:type II toxin-antitoxin system RatA family toxin [Brachymonas sp.]